jgi:hypothetical protein
MKNAVFWDINTQFVNSQETHYFSLQSPVSYYYVRFEVFMAVTMENVVSWEVLLLSVFHLLVTANVVSSSLILFALMMEAICFSETSVLNKSHRAPHPRRRHY